MCWSHEKLNPTLTNNSSLSMSGKDGAGSAAVAEKAKPIEFSLLGIIYRVLQLSVEKGAKRQGKKKYFFDFLLWTLSGCHSFSTALRFV